MSLQTATLAVVLLTCIITPAQTASQTAGPATGRPISASQWHEPHGRYTITLPAGWQVDDSQGNLKITNGTSWAIFDTTSGQGAPLDIAQKASAQMQPMVSDWKVYGQGPFITAAQHPAAGITVGCTVPTRTGPTNRVMLFLAQSAGGGNFVTMT